MALIIYPIWSKHNTDLVHHSTRITYFDSYDDYVWRNNDEVLIVRCGPKGGCPAMQTAQPNGNMRAQMQSNWSLVNVHSGSERPASACGSPTSPPCKALAALFDDQLVMGFITIDAPPEIQKRLWRPEATVKQFLPGGHEPINRDVWVVESLIQPGRFARLHRWIPFIPDSVMVAREFWVSHDNGSQLRLLGRLAGPPGSFGQGFQYPQFNWSPDGKRLSFTFEHALYTVPVE
jgi:hypothetical protein